MKKKITKIGNKNTIIISQALLKQLGIVVAPSCVQVSENQKVNKAIDIASSKISTQDAAFLIAIILSEDIV